jgi:hypothetical protein
MKHTHTHTKHTPMHAYIDTYHINIHIQHNIHRACPSARHNEIEECKYKVVLGSKTGHIGNDVVVCIENRTAGGKLKLPPSLGYEENPNQHRY